MAVHFFLLWKPISDQNKQEKREQIRLLVTAHYNMLPRRHAIWFSMQSTSQIWHCWYVNHIHFVVHFHQEFDAHQPHRARILRTKFLLHFLIWCHLHSHAAIVAYVYLLFINDIRVCLIFTIRLVPRRFVCLSCLFVWRKIRATENRFLCFCIEWHRIWKSIAQNHMFTWFVFCTIKYTNGKSLC